MSITPINFVRTLMRKSLEMPPRKVDVPGQSDLHTIQLSGPVADGSADGAAWNWTSNVINGNCW